MDAVTTPTRRYCLGKAKAPPATGGANHCVRLTEGSGAAGPLVVVRGYQFRLLDPLTDIGQHLANAAQIGEDVAFAFLIVDALAVHEHLHDALAARGDCYCRIRAEMPEELVCHPRGSTEMLSTDAVGNLNLDFAFHVVLRGFRMPSV